MARKLITIIWLAEILFATGLLAQDAAPDTNLKYADVCHRFSNLIGEELDSLPNTSLYLFVDEWLGAPYKYAGDCREGIDCSGFAGRLYEHIYGMRLQASSGELFKNSKPLKRSALEEGDLVFFKIRKHRISHVGVYLRNNKFVHASVKNGVIISDLNEPYYKKYFFKGGRIQKTQSAERQ